MEPRAAVEKASAIRCWCLEVERETVAKEAAMVKGRIVEIGGLYGGMTAVMALASPESQVTVIDDFSWDPDNVGVSAEALLGRVGALGITNVDVQTGDSRAIGKTWKEPIDMLWIDGGHDYEFVLADLNNFGPHARKILLHDYKNPFWPSVEKAIGVFISKHPGWRVDYNIEQVVVLQRKGG
jgi:hypothetical protein